MTRTSRPLDWTLSLSDGIAFAFALFTLVHNLVYALHGSLAAAVAMTIAAWLGLFVLSRRFAFPRTSTRDGDRARALPSVFDGPAPLPIVLGAIAVIGLFDPLWLSTPVMRQRFAIVTSLVAGFLVWRQARRAAPFASDPSTAGEGRRVDDALVAIAMIGGAVLSACVLRPDADDGAYYGHVVYAAEHPFESLPHFYAVVGLGRAPLPYPSYPLMALHDLVAVGAAILGRDPVDVAGAVLAPIGGALVVLAYAVGARVLAGERFRIVFVVALLLLLLDGTAAKGLGDFAFVRIWQGKSLLCHVVVPLLAAAAVRFGERPTFLTAARVFALLVAATGLSSIAIWLGPLVAGIGTLAGILASGGSLRPALFVPVLSVYPLLLGVFSLAGSMATMGTGSGAPGQDATTLAEPFVKVLGPLLEQRILLGASILAAFVAPTRRLRALAAVSSFIVLGLITHEAIGPAFSRYVTSRVVYWRVLWIIPLPLLVGGTVAWAHALPRGAPRAFGLVASFAIAVYALVEVPAFTTLARENRTAFAPPPHAQLIPADDAVVRALAERADGRRMIVAPKSLAWVLAVRREAPLPYLARANMAGIVGRASWGGSAESHRRLYALEYASGRRPFRSGPLATIAERDDVQAFVVQRNAAGANRMETLLRARGYGPTETLGRYLVWWRLEDSGSAEASLLQPDPLERIRAE